MGNCWGMGVRISWRWDFRRCECHALRLPRPVPATHMCLLHVFVM